MTAPKDNSNLERKSPVEVESLFDILDAMPIAAIAANQKGEILEANSAAADLFGVKTKQLRGRNTNEFFSSDGETKDSATLCIAGRNATVRLRRRSTVIRQMTIDIISLSAASESKVPHNLNDAEREQSQNKEDVISFLALASHDLKSPLRRSKSFIDLVSKNYGALLDERGEDWMNRCSKNLDLMQSLIDDLTLFSSIQSRPQKMLDCCLQTAAEMAISKLRISQFPDATIHFETPLPSIKGDSTLLCLLFEKLFDNSLRFNENSAPSIQIYCSCDKENWEISVEDNGIGIEEKFRGAAFELFKKRHPDSRYSGTGLGLAISNRIVSHHHGNLSLPVEQPSQGTRFLITLPLNPSR
ncbi:MAG: ATP-binding protein [Pseudohongiellaceae bacterium]